MRYFSKELGRKFGCFGYIEGKCGGKKGQNSKLTTEYSENYDQENSLLKLYQGVLFTRERREEQFQKNNQTGYIVKIEITTQTGYFDKIWF